MKSPQHLATSLARQWARADWREHQLLGGSAAWPLSLPIGQPDTQIFLHDAAALQAHLRQWREVENLGIGEVLWQERRYRGSSSAVSVPSHWQLGRPSEFLAGIEQFKAPEHAQIKGLYLRLGRNIAGADPAFQRLLVRRLALWRDLPDAEVQAALRLAGQLEPGCAQGKPLRMLALGAHDSKFWERNGALLTSLLDLRFAGEASRQGLIGFLGALHEGDHWLLVVPMAPGLLPFARLRVTAKELQHTALPARRILLVENESSLHQLPSPLADCIAVLGSGLDLQWLSADWLQNCQVAYWGDLDTWGLAMLATARGYLPQLQALLMEQTVFDSHQSQAVAEPAPADPALYARLPPQELALAQYLRAQELGRLEQEFLPGSLVAQAVHEWLQAT
ncbi:Wadjet anti-phage system protein JetD domain-containing protein [Comamonas sp. J-3]|uniref:Wadjet anti-phage system protein JetD domain-containing protein n=1 Tax=Comamonas trifloxystrobinivorans TaxID=3350256 RepID=UPI00372C8FD9